MQRTERKRVLVGERRERTYCSFIFLLMFQCHVTKLGDSYAAKKGCAQQYKLWSSTERRESYESRTLRVLRGARTRSTGSTALKSSLIDA